MESAAVLKSSRDLLLKLHKGMIDHERSLYERINGPVNSGQFLSLLLDDAGFAWLRRFSSLIVEIDETFDSKEGVDQGLVDELLKRVRELVTLDDAEDYYRNKYEAALQENVELVGIHGELKALLRK
ncbi:MAG TPA: hypothetical protein VJ781_07350 [Pyrinomonadaceae bacterium]|jgi:hypothetical protein|nr:hypothetical protein [Pyrinomonadaceae bacterium]